MIFPIVSNNCCSALIGYYSEQDNAVMANIFTRLLYAFCKFVGNFEFDCISNVPPLTAICLGAFYCICLSSLILYSGLGLIRLLDSHLRVVVDGRQHDVFKTGRMKVGYKWAGHAAMDISF